MKLLKSIDQNSHIVKTNYLITLFSFLFVLVFVSICYILDFEFKFSDFTWSLIFIGYIVFVYIFRYINKVNLVEIYSLFYNHPLFRLICALEAQKFVKLTRLIKMNRREIGWDIILHSFFQIFKILLLKTLVPIPKHRYTKPHCKSD